MLIIHIGLRQRAAATISRITTRTLAIRLVGIAAIAVLSPSMGFADYEFVNIVDNTGEFAELFYSFPSMNSQGAVAFYGVLDSGKRGVFLAEDGAVATIFEQSVRAADPAAPWFIQSSGGSPSINDWEPLPTLRAWLLQIRVSSLAISAFSLVTVERLPSPIRLGHLD